MGSIALRVIAHNSGAIPEVKTTGRRSIERPVPSFYQRGVACLRAGPNSDGIKDWFWRPSLISSLTFEQFRCSERSTCCRHAPHMYLRLHQ